MKAWKDGIEEKSVNEGNREDTRMERDRGREHQSVNEEKYEGLERVRGTEQKSVKRG